MKSKSLSNIVLIAQLLECLTFVLEDPGSNPAKGILFFFPVPFTFLKKLESLDHFLEHLNPLNHTNNL